MLPLLACILQLVIPRGVNLSEVAFHQVLWRDVANRAVQPLAVINPTYCPTMRIASSSDIGTPGRMHSLIERKALASSPQLML